MTVIPYPRQTMQPLALYLHMIPPKEYRVDLDCDLWLGPLTEVKVNAMGLALTFAMKEDARCFGLNPEHPCLVVIGDGKHGMLHFQGRLYPRWHICLRDCCESTSGQPAQWPPAIGAANSIDDLLMSVYEAHTELPDGVDFG